MERVGRALRIHRDAPTRALFATDASIYHCLPAGVFYPRDEGDLVRAVEVCGEHGVSLLPRGAGTSLSGQALTSGIIVDMSRFRAVRIDGERAWVQPGVVIDDLDRAAATIQRRWGPAPASANRATIGGLLANNGTGARSVVFGMASDHLHAARLLLADGSIRAFRRGDLDRVDALTREVVSIAEPVWDSPRWPRTWRNASGLDLRGIRTRESLLPLFCGSEGRLGILLDAEVSLVPRPARSVLCVFYYDDLVEAMRAVPPLLELGPSAIELMDRNILALARQSAHFRLRLITGEPAAIFMVEFEAPDSGADAAARLEAQVRAARGLGARMVLTDPADQREIWNTRKEGLGLLMSSRARRRPLPFIEDCAVPVPALPEYVERLNAILERHGTEGAFYAHASAGCLHVRPLIDLHDPADRAHMDAILEETAALVGEHGGTLSGEHGDGFSKSPHLAAVFGDEIVGAFERVRRAFDPQGLFRVPRKAGLRVDRPRRAFSGFLAREEGFAGAVERCNGEGACKKREGTMCPSYQASGDEALSTRGRANLLAAWLAVSPGDTRTKGAGRYGDDEAALAGELDRSLGACLACKACSSECPSSVDMAGLKAEWLASRGPSWSDRFFASYADLALVGRVLGGVPLAGIVKRLFGIDHRAELAAPVREGFFDRWKKEGRAWGQDPALDPAAADVLLFVDTHAEFFEPGVGEAFCRLASAAGLRVAPVRPGCCQRPAFSRGMLDVARAGLAGWTLAGSAPLVVLEPSCLSMLRDDAPKLVPEFSSLASRVVGAEAFLLAHAGRLAFEEGPDFLLHAHCHQKAEHGDDAVRRLLELAAPVSVLDAGCCGMAGSFGYDAATYNLSLAVAEDRFLPGLRAAGERAVALTGRSCREMATRHGLGGRHPLMLLASRLKSSA